MIGACDTGPSGNNEISWDRRNDPPRQVPRSRSSGSPGLPSRSAMAWLRPATNTWLVTRQRAGTMIDTRAAGPVAVDPDLSACSSPVNPEKTGVVLARER